MDGWPLSFNFEKRMTTRTKVPSWSRMAASKVTFFGC
uniref:Uncharacterized protein n=1 Tax=Arundo donax TaxID=35708 RepID=A0A0A9D9K6_ARUDO